MTTIGFAEPDIRPVQQQCADPIRETPGQCEQHNKVCGDFTIRLFQPALQRLAIHIELFCNRFARISVFLHQHIKGFQKRLREIALKLLFRIDLIQFPFVD